MSVYRTSTAGMPTVSNLDRRVYETDTIRYSKPSTINRGERERSFDRPDFRASRDGSPKTFEARTRRYVYSGRYGGTGVAEKKIETTSVN